MSEYLGVRVQEIQARGFIPLLRCKRVPLDRSKVFLNRLLPIRPATQTLLGRRIRFRDPENRALWTQVFLLSYRIANHLVWPIIVCHDFHIKKFTGQRGIYTRLANIVYYFIRPSKNLLLPKGINQYSQKDLATW